MADIRGRERRALEQQESDLEAQYRAIISRTTDEREIMVAGV